MATFLGTNQLLLITLLVKIGVMASLATALNRHGPRNGRNRLAFIASPD